MIIEPLAIGGAFRIRTESHVDERGFFARTFDADVFRANGLETEFIQRSVSFNAHRGTLRGLHFQSDPDGETKTVRCTRGAVFDVLVDLRLNSPTYGKWHGEILTPEAPTILYVPTGCAHGFQTLSDASEIYYEISTAYVPQSSRGVRFDDPALAVRWPIDDPILSDRDRQLPLLRDL
jgi:dTDP-4-dehydrorhamnose 3,5-epimerase